MGTIRRAEAIGITWPVVEEIDDATLERRLFACPGAPVLERDAVDWPKVHEELKRRGVTLLLLWQEYRAGDQEGYAAGRAVGAAQAARCALHNPLARAPRRRHGERAAGGAD